MSKCGKFLDGNVFFLTGADLNDLKYSQIVAVKAF